MGCRDGIMDEDLILKPSGHMIPVGCYPQWVALMPDSFRWSRHAHDHTEYYDSD